MAVSLEIRDGNPWWLSPDLWTVPGSDPEGPEGVPIEGQSCYVWARVTNNGTTPVQNATVRFYWANPAVGFDRTTANLIGISYVTLDDGESKEVLCLTPWVPEFVNEGHECILAEAFHSSLDPLPGTQDFNVPTDRHVAQRNINVLRAAKGMFKLVFEVHNTERKARSFRIRAFQAKLGQVEPLIPHLGLDSEILGKEAKVRKLGFVNEFCPGRNAFKDAIPEIEEIEVGPNQRICLTLIGAIVGEGASLVHVEQLAGDCVIGGLSALVLQETKPDECEKGGESQT